MCVCGTTLKEQFARMPQTLCAAVPVGAVVVGVAAGVARRHHDFFCRPDSTGAAWAVHGGPVGAAIRGALDRAIPCVTARIANNHAGDRGIALVQDRAVEVIVGVVTGHDLPVHHDFQWTIVPTTITSGDDSHAIVQTGGCSCSQGSGDRRELG